MRLYDEILKNVNISELFAGARCDFFPFGGGYFQGVKGIGEFTPQRIVLTFKRAEVEVIGEDLVLSKYFEGDLRITGKIRSVGVVEGSER